MKNDRFWPIPAGLEGPHPTHGCRPAPSELSRVDICAGTEVLVPAPFYHPGVTAKHAGETH